MKQFAKIAAVLATLVLACAFVACGDEDDGDSVVCTWRMSGNSSNFYVFYADKTVEAWVDGRLGNSRNELRYTGNPIANGTVEIKTISGVTMFRFNISGSVATESTYRTRYYKVLY